jgi:hypothetical protein
MFGLRSGCWLPRKFDERNFYSRCAAELQKIASIDETESNNSVILKNRNVGNTREFNNTLLSL